MNRQGTGQGGWKTVPGDLKSVKIVSKDIMASMSGLGFSDSALFDIRLCVEEAVSNAVKYGCRDRSEAAVDYSLSVTGGSVEISVRCPGSSFNPSSVPDPTAPENIERGSGRGIFLINKLMDKVVFENGGGTVRMTKRRKNVQ